MLNEEWIDIQAIDSRSMVNDVLTSLAHDNACSVTGVQVLCTFPSIQLLPGQSIRVHTGSGTAGFIGHTYHYYLGRSWFVWNNGCGDRATVSYNGGVVDSAWYAARVPEGVLVRSTNSDELVPRYKAASGW